MNTKFSFQLNSILGIRKRVDELLGFCRDHVEDFKFNITWNSPQPSKTAVSIRRGGSPYSRDLSSNPGMFESSPVQSQRPNSPCQIKEINDLCQPLMITVKFNPSWSNIKKRGWCQQSRIYYLCLKSRLDKCPQQDVQNQFKQVEHYLRTQININCPGGVDGCTHQSRDVRCKTGVVQSDSTLPIFYFSYCVVQMVLHMLLFLLLF